MKEFARLLENLILTPSRNRKIELLSRYFSETPDPDRGIALAILTDNLDFPNVKAGLLKEIAQVHVDPHLFKLSYDYVGDLAETISLIWPYEREDQTLPPLSELVEKLQNSKKKEIPDLLENYLNCATPTERLALIKMATGGLRIGVSARLAKTALADMSGEDLQEIEQVWHGLIPPYENLFAWLTGTGNKPVIKHTDTFHPLMLSNPVDEDKDFEKLDPKDFSAEWKWDGIRVQLVMGKDKKALYSRTGDDISRAFPDIIDHVKGSAVLDGELLVGHNFKPEPFNHLQKRLNRKTVDRQLLEDNPAFIRVYDILFSGDKDVRGKPLTDRRKILEQWFHNNKQSCLDLSLQLDFKDWDHLGKLREDGANRYGYEGVMIKKKDSPYLPGRPKGFWYKWKRDPYTVDAILMYAQRGHGKRSSFYSDFTFGVWKGNEIVPIGKAYFGFTDEELKELDKFVRNNTINRFGPVREVKKELVLEIAFDSAHESPRHKSGIALRFPRISRIRWDKPVNEVETIDQMGIYL